MPNRSVTFSFAANPTSGDVTNSLSLAIKDGTSTPVPGTPLVFDKARTSYTTDLPVGVGYTATLTALSLGGVPDPHPPSVSFDVPAVPPPPAPGDPTLHQPTIN